MLCYYSHFEGSFYGFNIHGCLGSLIWTPLLEARQPQRTRRLKQKLIV